MAENGGNNDVNEPVEEISILEISQEGENALDLVEDVLLKIPRELYQRFDIHDYFCRRNTDDFDPVIARNIRYRWISEQDFFVIGDYGGLVVEQRQRGDFPEEYRVRSVATGEIDKLPPPLKGTKYDNLVFDHNPYNGETKILREYHYKSTRTRKGMEILTIGGDKKNWRGSERPLEFDENSKTLGHEDIHFSKFLINEGIMSLKICTFELRRESFATNTLCLSTAFKDLSRARLFWWESRLAVGNFRSKELEVMVLEREEGNYRWGEEKKVVPLTFLGKTYYGRDKIFPLRFISGRDFWFGVFGKEKKYFCYDVEVKVIKQTVCGRDKEKKSLWKGCFEEEDNL